MTAQVLDGFFRHGNNRLEAARQAYKLAKEHKREVMNLPAWDGKRFHEAVDRESAAREAYLALLMER